ncbi:MAG: shikimate dehydrogenase [Solirubrobacteraceae bacterium]|nr:shikimate dehydrogenase [Solirubrobacteraceae bacterium]
MPAPHAGVLGRPITHSLSPVLHRAAYAALGLTWTYDAIECGVDDLAAVLTERADWAGFSATMPLKRALLDVAAEIRPAAELVGAANTLLPGPDGWIADNTDVAGVTGALVERDVHPSSVTVLGAGGTAQAVIVAMPDIGLDACAVLVRDVSRTAQLRAAAERAGVALQIGSLESGAVALQADLVISTLPGGAADPLAARRWSSGQAVLDVVYSPWPTKLAASAAAAGATVLSGGLMLLHQAAAQVELMTEQPAPVEAMRAALAAAAPGCGV